MTVSSRVNPNFPIPGIDQSSKGFRDNFSTIKTEIESLQGKEIYLTGDVTSDPVIFDSGNSPIVIPTTITGLSKNVPYIISGFFPGTMSYAQILMAHTFVAPVTFPMNFGNNIYNETSTGSSLINATSTTILPVYQCLAANDPTNISNWISIGTITYESGGHSATFSTSGNLSFTPGDSLIITSPSSPDATLANVYISLAGIRTT